MKTCIGGRNPTECLCARVQTSTPGTHSNNAALSASFRRVSAMRTTGSAELRTSAWLRSGATDSRAAMRVSTGLVLCHQSMERTCAASIEAGLYGASATVSCRSGRTRRTSCSWFRVRTGGRAGSRPCPRLRRLRILPFAGIVPSVNGGSLVWRPVCRSSSPARIPIPGRAGCRPASWSRSLPRCLSGAYPRPARSHLGPERWPGCHQR